MPVTTANRFHEVIAKVNGATPSLRAQMLIDSLSKILVTSNNTLCQQLGNELQEAKYEILSSWQEAS